MATMAGVTTQLRTDTSWDRFRLGHHLVLKFLVTVTTACYAFLPFRDQASSVCEAAFNHTMMMEEEEEGHAYPEHGHGHRSHHFDTTEWTESWVFKVSLVTLVHYMF